MSSFDRLECSDCPVRTRCTGGKLVGRVLLSMERDVDATYDSFRSGIIDAALDEDSKEFITLTRDTQPEAMDQARDRYHAVGRALNSLMLEAINAQSQPEIPEFSIDNRRSRIEEIIEEFSEGRVRISDIPTIETVQASAEDAIDYYHMGACYQSGFLLDVAELN